MVRIDKLFVARALMMGSLIATALALYGAFISDIWLASTQWMIVANWLGILGIFLRLES